MATRELGRTAWFNDLRRAEATRDAIATCVAPSPAQRAWLERTDAGIAAIRRHLNADRRDRSGRWSAGRARR